MPFSAPQMRFNGTLIKVVLTYHFFVCALLPVNQLLTKLKKIIKNYLQLSKLCLDLQKHFYLTVMKTENASSKVHTAAQIRQANPKGDMSYVSGTLDIVFKNGVVFTSETSRQRKTLWNKLQRMGYNRGYNFSSDEFDGICQAAQLGENPFAYSIICANPSLNEICK
jgi:hypothetical protein